MGMHNMERYEQLVGLSVSLPIYMNIFIFELFLLKPLFLDVCDSTFVCRQMLLTSDGLQESGKL